MLKEKNRLTILEMKSENLLSIELQIGTVITIKLGITIKVESDRVVNKEKIQGKSGARTKGKEISRD